VALAEQRAEARGGKDYAASDRLRDEIAALGWTVRDSADGYDLSPRPPYDVLAAARDLPDRSASPDTRRASVAVLVEGWPDDVRRCLESVLRHAPADVAVIALDAGNVGGAGDALHDIASAAEGRVEAWHVEHAAGWAEARTALLRADSAAIHVWLDPSIELTGDALTPVIAAFDDERVVAAGGWGVNVAADWRSFDDAPPGDVDALLGYLFAVRRSAALAIGGPHPKARFYRNADMEFSLALREGAGPGARVVATPPLPAVKHRHRGYHDTDPAYRDRESKRTYDRLLKRFRP
jgi:hypothetical protein